MAPTLDHKGWYVPRALPHFDGAKVVQAITFRLADSLPRAVIEDRSDEDDPTYRRRIAAALDAGHGECLLRDKVLAEIVEAALLHGAADRYGLLAWVIMPNHVHVLLRQLEGFRLCGYCPSLEIVDCKGDHRHRNTSGHVWQKDYFDRYMRTEPQFTATIAYIEENPVKAGLAATSEEWRFGSVVASESTFVECAVTKWAAGTPPLHISRTGRYMHGDRSDGPKWPGAANHFVGPIMTPIEDDLVVRRKRVRFRAWHRGMREVDLLLGGFADAHLAELGVDELGAFEALLDVPDQDVLAWLTDTGEPPDGACVPVLRRVYAFHHGGA